MKVREGHKKLDKRHFFVLLSGNPSVCVSVPACLSDCLHACLHCQSVWSDPLYTLSSVHAIHTRQKEKKK